MIDLFWTKFVVSIKNLIEELKIVTLYYGNYRFLRADLALHRSYFFKNPFRISKQFLKNRGEREIYAYGETPLTTLDLIARRCGITDRDRVIELGCGRGRTCFWLNLILHCQVKGVDFIPEFIEKAEKIKEKLKLEGIEFQCLDIVDVDLQWATVLYLYGTCLEDETIRELIRKIPAGIKVITVSYPLSDYSPHFKLLDTFTAPFTWGSTEVYLQEKK